MTVAKTGTGSGLSIEELRYICEYASNNIPKVGLTMIYETSCSKSHSSDKTRKSRLSTIAS